MSFPGPLGSKRRRMRSGGSITANPTEIVEENISEQKTTQTSKCKGASTIPIFLKKTYKMVDTCDPSMAAWTDDGEMFVVKDPDLFASEVIPQYFDHNKFSSFARQLNFYGFRKMQAKPIKNSDYDAGTSKHVTFFNENFKRGRCDLLKKIQRSTRGGGGGGPNVPTDQNREVVALKEQVSKLEAKVADLETKSVERVRRLELDMLSRMEQMMMAAHSHQLSLAPSVGGNGSSSLPPLDNQGSFLGRASSINSAVNSVANAVAAGGGVFASPRNGSYSFPGSVTFPGPATADSVAAAGPMAAPTLPPHPKQKHLPSGSLPIGNSMPAPPNRLNSLRGLSALRSISGLSRGLSMDSTGSPIVMRTAWEDKMFSQIMLGENGEPEVTETAAIENSNFVSNDSSLGQPTAATTAMDDDNMSDVSNPEMQ